MNLVEGVGLIWIAVVGLFKLAPMWRSQTEVPPEPAWYPWSRGIYLFVFKVTVPVMVLIIAGGIIFIGVFVEDKGSPAGHIVKLFGDGIAAIAGVVLFTVIAWETQVDHPARSPPIHEHGILIDVVAVRWSGNICQVTHRRTLLNTRATGCRLARISRREGRGVRSAPELGARAGSRHRGDTMPTVIGHHDVKDTAHWLASPKREEVFGPLGVTNIRTFVDPQNSNRVAVLMDVADMDVVMAAMETPALAEAMEYDGVLPETLVILVEA